MSHREILLFMIINESMSNRAYKTSVINIVSVESVILIYLCYKYCFCTGMNKTNKVLHYGLFLARTIGWGPEDPSVRARQDPRVGASQICGP